ncbi:hypothetical protein BDK51DRAFT_49439 [Blyttiomyces helicus]|uniref:Uncharacterized protein n=1 Tax=Blyttiomyces helicus TaxID=388810 RepID=A0A4P9WHU2_9FUNG|nr:hypothetical protein BDK51DRAFT_49439 [Blyttiomyces helicus]|eukprot:RKO91535.1 hypothetical protein BDK51DRAFT_49439 [Blyttiomyces helicus]
MRKCSIINAQEAATQVVYSPAQVSKDWRGLCLERRRRHPQASPSSASRSRRLEVAPAHACDEKDVKDEVVRMKSPLSGQGSGRSGTAQKRTWKRKKYPQPLQDFERGVKDDADRIDEKAQQTRERLSNEVKGWDDAKGGGGGGGWEKMENGKRIPSSGAATEATLSRIHEDAHAAHPEPKLVQWLHFPSPLSGTGASEM